MTQAFIRHPYNVNSNEISTRVRVSVCVLNFNQQLSACVCALIVPFRLDKRGGDANEICYHALALNWTKYLGSSVIMRLFKCRCRPIRLKCSLIY